MNKLLMILLISVSISAFADAIKLTVPQQNNLGIQVTAVKAAQANAMQKFTAEVILPATQMRIVSTSQQGLIDALHVAVGDQVRKGQVIGHLSSSELVGLQSGFLQLQTKLQLATKTLARDEKLFKEGIIPERRVLEARSAHDELTAAIAEKRQTLHLAGMGDNGIQQLNAASGLSSGLAILSPMNGQVIEQMVAVGERVASTSPVYKIANLDRLWLEIHVPVATAMTLKSGMKIRVPGVQTEGKVLTVLRNINKANQTMPVRAEIRSNMLAIGQFVEAEIMMSTQNALQVPHQAIVRHGKNTVVFKQTAAGFISVPVEILTESDGFVHIRANLQAQDLVATTGTAALKGAWLGIGGGE